MALAERPGQAHADHLVGRERRDAGRPVRLPTSAKLGFKNPKWITAIEVTNMFRGGYWEDQGYPWFGGV